MNWFEFTDVPPVGLRVRYRKQFVTLQSAAPHVSRDGRQTHILTWKTDDGLTGTSGLRGNSIVWAKMERATA